MHTALVPVGLSPADYGLPTEQDEFVARFESTPLPDRRRDDETTTGTQSHAHFNRLAMMCETWRAHRMTSSHAEPGTATDQDIG